MFSKLRYSSYRDYNCGFAFESKARDPVRIRQRFPGRFRKAVVVEMTTGENGDLPRNSIPVKIVTGQARISCRTMQCNLETGSPACKYKTF
ncbi:hypothetical protein Trydic_g19276 [Trypoxylus dichotomus]